METLISYGIRIAPGLTALLFLLVLLPKQVEGLRITVYIGIFIVIRDAMTPAGLWSIGTEGFFWIRFVDSLPLLLFLAAGSGAVSVAMLVAEPEWRKRIDWLGEGRGGSSAAGILAGLLGAAVTAGPLLLVYALVSFEAPGGSVSALLLPGIVAVALVGNFYEELLFRGFLQDYLHATHDVKPLYAAVISGTAFAAGHSFLAVTVTSVGAPLLLFALYEGVIAGLIRMRWGLIPAVLSHGGAILLLAGGFI